MPTFQAKIIRQEVAITDVEGDNTPVSFKLDGRGQRVPCPLRRMVFRQASSRCKATVWETRSPKISLASSTPRN
jgi:hypothetical protein